MTSPEATFLQAMLGPGPRGPDGGPPYVHVHQFPVEPEDGPAPEHVPFTITTAGRPESQEGQGLPARERA